MRLLVVRCLVFVVVQALMLERVNAGAICSTGAASSALIRLFGFGWSFCRRAVGCAVLNDDAGAVRRSVSRSVGQY